MESEKNYTLKEAKDLLRHVKQQRLDYRAFPPIRRSGIMSSLSQGTGAAVDDEEENAAAAAAEDSSWQYFDELPDRSKFLLLFHILNEKTFKGTVFNLLNLIKSSTYPQMNASFVCLSSHIEGIYEASLSQLRASSS